MSLYDTYNQWLHKKITDDEAAKEYGMSVSNFRMRVSKYGKRLAITLKTLDRIARDEIDRQEAAKILNVSTRQVNNLQESWRVTRPLKEYIVTRTISTVKWELRKRSRSNSSPGPPLLKNAQPTRAFLSVRCAAGSANSSTSTTESSSRTSKSSR